MMETYMLPAKERFECEMDGRPVSLYYIYSADGSRCCAVTNYGARIVSLLVPDKAGRQTDVVLGYESIGSYLQQPEDYMGAVVGRCANRIAAGLFVLNGHTCVLPINDGPNTLHGGPKGFHARVWNVVRADDDTLVLSYRSTNGEEGFPGNVDVSITYQWIDAHTLQMRYYAVTDAPTLLNLSNHSYFNLSGEGSSTIRDHLLKIPSNAITAVNETLIPTGQLQDVVKSPFDFREPCPIGARIDHENDQLGIGKGYDHNFVLDEAGEPVELSAPDSGIRLLLRTDRPGMQFYSGNFLDGSRKGKSGKPYQHRSAVVLEPQGFPDAIHHPQFPSVILKPNQVYNSVSDYQFSTY